MDMWKAPSNFQPFGRSRKLWLAKKATSSLSFDDNWLRTVDHFAFSCKCRKTGSFVTSAHTLYDAIDDNQLTFGSIYCLTFWHYLVFNFLLVVRRRCTVCRFAWSTSTVCARHFQLKTTEKRKLLICNKSYFLALNDGTCVAGNRKWFCSYSSRDGVVIVIDCVTKFKCCWALVQINFRFTQWNFKWVFSQTYNAECVSWIGLERKFQFTIRSDAKR